MNGVESAMATPVVKDVQTLKANLKEQEKRARSENEVQAVIQVIDPQPAAEEEQRKRRRISKQAEPNPEPELAVLDGPLQPTKEQTKPATDQSTPSKTHESPVSKQKVSVSPTKADEKTESSNGSKPEADAPTDAYAPASAECEIRKPGSSATLNPAESPKKPVASNNGPLSVDGIGSEKVKETEAVGLEQKELGTEAEPVETTE